MSSPRLIDAHTHVQFAAFKEDAKEVIDRTLKNGVWMINVGTQKDTSQKAIELAGKYEKGVYATVGLHPIHTDKSYHDDQELGLPSEALAKEGWGKGFESRGEEFDFDYYKKLAQHPKVVAIGECGLDYYRVKSNELRVKQESAFRKQIELALEIKKPLMIHCREAFDDLIAILNPYFQIPHSNKNPGIVHFFSGTKDHAEKLLEMGFSFTFGGVITFVHNYDKIVKMIPINRILTETDAPYVTPVPYRGKRNEPLYVEEVAKRIADIKGISFEEIARQTVENAQRIFGISE